MTVTPSSPQITSTGVALLPDAEVREFFEYVQQKDTFYWQTAKRIALEAKGVNWSNCNPPRTFSFVLSAAYMATQNKQEDSFEFYTRTLLQVLPVVERAKLAKVLTLIPGSEGQLLRKFLYPMIYRTQAVGNILSDGEIVDAALKLVSELAPLSATQLACLKIPVLKGISPEEQCEIVQAWKESLEARKELFTQGEEPLFPRFYTYYNRQTQTTFVSPYLHTPQTSCTLHTYCLSEFEITGYSPILAGLNATCSSYEECTLTATSVALCVQSYFPPFNPETNQNYCALFSCDEKKLPQATIEYLQNYRASHPLKAKCFFQSPHVAIIERAFLNNFLPILQPVQWESLRVILPKPSPLLPSYEHIVSAVAKSTLASFPARSLLTGPIHESDSDSDELTIDEQETPETT